MRDLSKYVYNDKNKIYTFDLKQIREAEEDMGIKFPKELREFYEKYGYGFISNELRKCHNRLLAASQCADVRLRRDYYKYDLELESYEDYENRDNRLIFFEVNEGEYLTIQLDEEGEEDEQSAIYSGWIKIADSLEEFIIKMYDDGCYYWEEALKARRRRLETGKF